MFRVFSFQRKLNFFFKPSYIQKDHNKHTVLNSNCLFMSQSLLSRLFIRFSWGSWQLLVYCLVFLLTYCSFVAPAGEEGIAYNVTHDFFPSQQVLGSFRFCILIFQVIIVFLHTTFLPGDHKKTVRLLQAAKWPYRKQIVACKPSSSSRKSMYKQSHACIIHAV